MFIRLNKKYVDLNNNDAELPFDFNVYRLSLEHIKSYEQLLWETFNSNPIEYSDNKNTVSFLLNTDSISTVTDCTSENFNNHYLYYYLGSKAKILLKNNTLIYVTETFEQIMEKISG